jgi:hypothetical protein
MKYSASTHPERNLFQQMFDVVAVLLLGTPPRLLVPAPVGVVGNATIRRIP